jgi:hypothetical protein
MNNEQYAKGLSIAAKGLYGDRLSPEARKLQLALLITASLGVLVGSGLARVAEASAGGFTLTVEAAARLDLFIGILLVYLLVVYLIAVWRSWRMSYCRRLPAQVELGRVQDALEQELAANVAHIQSLSAAFDERLAKRKELAEERDRNRDNSEKHNALIEKLDELCRTDGLDQIIRELESERTAQRIASRMRTVLSILRGRNLFDGFQVVLNILVPLALTGIGLYSLFTHN